MSKEIALFMSVLALVIGIMIGERAKGGFFRPWYDDGRIYVRDRVRYIKGTYDPDHCEYGILRDVIDGVALVEYCECWSDGDGPKYKGSFLKLLPANMLKKE